MHSLAAIVASLAAAACLLSAPDPTNAQAPSNREATLRRYGLDPTSSLDSRVRPAPAATLRMFEVPTPPPEPTEKPAHAATRPEAASPASHVLTTLERRALSVALHALPSLHQQILGERLRAIYFVDAPTMSGTALTVTITEDEPDALFDVVIRGTIFRESVSEFLTTKERTCFDASGSSLSVSIEAGTLDAIRYVMLHEATHIVDKSIQFTPLWRSTGPPPDVSTVPFTNGVWSTPVTPAPRFRHALLDSIRFRPEGRVLPVTQAAQVYAELRKTPFASLYGSINWMDDLAEYVAIAHWTETLRQPYRIVVRDGDGEVVAYEPMRSSLVRGRLRQVARFYEIAH